MNPCKTPLAQNSTSALKESERAWLEAFHLKSLEEPFIPNFSPEVQKALEPVLKGEQIKLTQGSLVKLEQRERDSLLPHTKPTLEQSDMILRDKENALIFVKDVGKTYYLTSVAKSSDADWTIRTNSFKTLNRLKNVVSDGGEILHMGEKAPNILAETFKVKTFSNQLADDSSAIGLKGQETGFSGGEVAGASDILESGGTAIKPSDLQINTPPSHGSALNPTSNSSTPPLKKKDKKPPIRKEEEEIKEEPQEPKYKPLEEVDSLEELITNWKDYAYSPNALNKLMELGHPFSQEYKDFLKKRREHGSRKETIKVVELTPDFVKVRPEFYDMHGNWRMDHTYTFPDPYVAKGVDVVDLPEPRHHTDPQHAGFYDNWKEVYGLKPTDARVELDTPPQAHDTLKELLPRGFNQKFMEVVWDKSPLAFRNFKNLLATPDVVIKERSDHMLALHFFRKDADGYKRTTIYKVKDGDAALNNSNLATDPTKIDGEVLFSKVKGVKVKPPLKTPHIEPNPVFGEHFAEFELKGSQAVAKLLQERRGQVAGAFYREDLGYIDLVWGNVEGKGNKATGWGLSKILEKHIDDFREFEGATPLEKLGNGINEIVQRGNAIKRAGREEAYNIEHLGFVVGVNKGYDKQGNSYWIVTAFDKKKPSTEKTAKTARASGLTKEADNLSLNSKPNPTKPPLNNQSTANQDTK
ncbi:putative barnase/colicin E5 family endoribonuclease [Helicobacter salomonis]|uniref:putative barnase/colicin E5 family endoribonuclease n=1 Tax=Helicobacter salomonis TaxID=56878 RepID=UPI000CF13241|nr:PBECR2 nuclease fold domain-containing protein [Helicobacter salomonis]